MEPLTQALDKTGIDQRLKRILYVSPGSMFGFPHPHTIEFVARIDCQICGASLDLFDESDKEWGLFEKRRDAFLHAIRDRNAVLRKAYEHHRARFILGWFAQKPIYEHEILDDALEAQANEIAVANLLRYKEFKRLRATCSVHWGTPDVEAISLDFETAYFARHAYSVGHVTMTGPS